MRKITVNLNLTLDGVMQAPGRADEDTRGGFQHGGWALPYFDPVMAQAAGEGIAQNPSLLFGRRTYQDFFSVWPGRTGDFFSQVLDNAFKYVASRTLQEPLPWANSVLLKGEADQTVATLKAQPGPDLVILGSGELVRSLIRQGLVDEYALSIHPLVLGSGQRLFPDGSPYSALKLVNSKATTTGVLIATYRPA